MNIMKNKMTAFLILLFATLLAQASLQDLFDGVWEQTKADATPTQRREYAAYVTLNTATDEYGLVSITPGPWAASNEGAGTTLPIRPNDNPANPTPLDKPTYVVAWFHTHTPTKFVTFPYRGIGPSTNDFAASVHPYINMPGFAYDYIAVATNNIPANSIPAGLDKDAPAKIYPITPPERRPTP